MTTTILDIIIFCAFVSGVSVVLWWLCTNHSRGAIAALICLAFVGLDYLICAASVWVILALLHAAGVALTVSFSWAITLASYIILVILKIVCRRR